jgi:hypothetical protein
MRILFLDSGLTMLSKNLLPIANYFNEKQNDFEAIFVSVEILSYSDSNIEHKSLQNLTSKPNYKFLIFKSSNRVKIKNLLETLSPDLIFIGGYRIFDQLWVGICNRLSIPTYKLQHGFEIDSVYYKPISIITNFKKGIRISYAIYNLSKFVYHSFFILYIQYLRYIFLGKSLKDTFLNNVELQPKNTFVYSDYYKTFWNNKFGFNINNMTNITPIDFLLIPQIKKQKRVVACCYIAQTLVEEGRMKKNDFTNIMKQYLKIAEKTEKFIIKLHPQSNIDLYDSFKKLQNVQFTRDFPNCTSYITHYSSMIYTASFLSDYVILHELKGHITPKIFKDVASYITDDFNEIENLIKQSSFSKEPDFDEKKSKIKFYAIFEDINPYEKIFNTIKSEFSTI